MVAVSTVIGSSHPNPNPSWYILPYLQTLVYPKLARLHSISQAKVHPPSPRQVAMSDNEKTSLKNAPVTPVDSGAASAPLEASKSRVRLVSLVVNDARSYLLEYYEVMSLGESRRI